MVLEAPLLKNCVRRKLIQKGRSKPLASGSALTGQKPIGSAGFEEWMWENAGQSGSGS